METSRIIRVDTRNYQGILYSVRIAAVSQGHVLACITRNETRPENGMVLVLGSVTVYRLPIRLPAKSALTWPVV